LNVVIDVELTEELEIKEIRKHTIKKEKFYLNPQRKAIWCVSSTDGPVFSQFSLTA